MSASIACNDDLYVICQTCKSEMTTEQLRCMRCCDASLSHVASSNETTAPLPEGVPIPLANRRKPYTVKLVTWAPPEQEKKAESIDPIPTPQKRPDPVITKPRQTIWLDSSATPLNTLAEICSQNLPALLPEPDPLEYGRIMNTFSLLGGLNSPSKMIEVAAEKLADEKLAAQKVAVEKLAAEVAADKLAAKKIAAEKIATEKLAAEKAAAEKLAAERLAAEKLAAEKAAAEGRLAAQKRAAERAAKERAATEKAAAEKAAKEKRYASVASDNAADMKRAAEKKISVEKLDAIIEIAKKMWGDVILEFTKGFTCPGLHPKSSSQKWKDDCQKIFDESKTRKTGGNLVFYKTTFIKVRDLALACLGSEWTNKCIDTVNYKNKDELQRLNLVPLNLCAPTEVSKEGAKISTRPVPQATPAPKCKEPELRVNAVPAKIHSRKPVPQPAELPWAIPGNVLLVFFTDKWLKATFVAKVQSGYKFAFADNTESVVMNTDVSWRVLSFEQITAFQSVKETETNKKRKLEIMVAEKEEMEHQHTALKKKVAVIELKMTEKKEMIAQLTACL